MRCFLQLALWHCFGSAAGGHMLKWSTETGLDPGKYRKTFKWIKRLSDHFQLFGPNLRLWHGRTGNYDALLNANPVPDDISTAVAVSWAKKHKQQLTTCVSDRCSARSKLHAYTTDPGSLLGLRFMLHLLFLAEVPTLHDKRPTNNFALDVVGHAHQLTATRHTCVAV